jgi:tripartite-type tricarboxylate transporter receptor subunit TctC
MRKRFLCLTVLLALMLAGTFVSAPVSLAAYPEKPVTMLCGFPAGGSLDATARAISEAAKSYFPKAIAVVNRPGATGSISVAEVVRAKPDGYTLGIAAVASLTVVPHRTKLPYGSPDDYLPIIKLVNIPICMSVKSDAPWKTLEELVADAKANPGKIRVGLAGGLGTLFHLNLEQFKALAKIDLTAVPFAGGAESVPALLGGHVGADVHTVQEILPHVQAGKARVLGVFEEKRNPLFPNAPTFREKGYDVTMAAYYLIFGPKGLPPQVVTTIHDSLKKAMEEQTFQKPMREGGFEISYEGPQDIKKRLMRDYEQCKVLVETLNLKEK